MIDHEAGVAPTHLDPASFVRDVCLTSGLPPPLQRSEVRHGAGHLIPSSGEALNALREFLLRQQQCLRASTAATPAV